jgi:hypothetical protein
LKKALATFALLLAAGGSLASNQVEEKLSDSVALQMSVAVSD